MSSNPLTNLVMNTGVSAVHWMARTWNEMYRNNSQTKAALQPTAAPSKRSVIEKQKVEEKMYTVPLSDKLQKLIVDYETVQKGAYEENQERLLKALDNFELIKNEIFTLRSQVKEKESLLVQKQNEKKALLEEIERELLQAAQRVKEQSAEINKKDIVAPTPFLNTSGNRLESLIEEIKQIERQIDLFREQEQTALERFKDADEKVKVEIEAKKRLKTIMEREIDESDKKLKEISESVLQKQ